MDEILILLGFPAEAGAYFLKLADDIQKDAPARRMFADMQGAFLLPARDFRMIDEAAAPLAARLSAPVESVSFLLLLSGLPALRRAYREKGYDDCIFRDGLCDFRSKLLECREMKGVWGSDKIGWFDAFFEMRRFQIGQFAYSMKTLETAYMLPDGRALAPGELMLACHIPSHMPPMTEAARCDSYRRAYRFFAPFLNRGLMAVTCHSWLLYPKLRQWLPQDSRILQFMRDWDILSFDEEPGFRDGWRVFGHEWTEHYAALPEKTSLQRAYKQKLLYDNQTGRGYGILVLDKNGIANHKEAVI